MSRSGSILVLATLASTLLARTAIAETAIAIDAGNRHTCALTLGGAVQCWGALELLGTGPEPDVSTPVPVSIPGLNLGVRAVAAGGEHTCALTNDGAVQCWGLNDQGQLGDGGTTYRSAPVAVTGLAVDIVALTSGLSHTCAVSTDGGVHCWGGNSYGQLGDGSKTNRASPVSVSGLPSGVVLVTAGERHTCVLTGAGAVHCWGGNGDGQLGDGTTASARSSPGSVTGLASGVVGIAAGDRHTCAVTRVGAVQCWGRNLSGQLGDATTFMRPTPVQVITLSSGVATVAAGGSHSCAVTTDGDVRCWGSNASGQLGNGTTTTHASSSPAIVSGLAGRIAAVALGGSHTCALTSDEAIRCWGSNRSGQLGDGTLAWPTPVPVAGLASGVKAIVTGCAVGTDGEVQCWGSVDGPLNHLSGLEADVVALAAGEAHKCAVTAGGAVQCWGSNNYGALGDGAPGPVVGLAGGAAAVTAAGHHTCALTKDGAVLCWGDNLFGQLGRRTAATGSTPEVVGGLSGPSQSVSTGAGRCIFMHGSSSSEPCWPSGHTCAVSMAGAVQCWGYNSYGQVGGTSNIKGAPVAVAGLQSGVMTVSAGFEFTCALTTAGTVLCWGHNDRGQLGQGRLGGAWSPGPVLGLTRVEAIDAGSDHACAVTSDGAVWCWGGNSDGQLGDGTRIDRSTPVRVRGLRTGVASVTAGDGSSCAITTDGAVHCWGNMGMAPPTGSPEPLGVVGFGVGSVGFFAEGTMGPLFGTRFAFLNPGNARANTWLDFRHGDGTRLPHFVAIPPRTRLTVDVADLFGPASVDFATTVASSEPLVVDRTMTWGDATTGAYGGHAERSMPAASTTWYLAEGSTAGDFNLFYLLQNPNVVEAPVRVRFLRPNGAALEKTYILAPSSRTNIWVDSEEFPGLGRALAATDVSAVLESTTNQPIIVERAMYLDRPGQVFAAGHASAGVTTPATQWFLAEGATGPYFDLFVLIANAGDTAALVEAAFLLPNGTTVTRSYTVAAASRSTVWVDQEGPELADTAVSTTIRSMNGVPIIVERAMWWPGSVGQWHEAHASAGASTAGTMWALAEGEIGGPRAADTYLLLANTSSSAATVKVTLIFEDTTSVEQTFAVPGRSRFNVDVRSEFPAAADRRFGAIVESVGPAPAEIVVERSMYWEAGGQRWAAGTNAFATRVR